MRRIGRLLALVCTLFVGVAASGPGQVTKMKGFPAGRAASIIFAVSRITRTRRSDSD